MHAGPSEDDLVEGGVQLAVAEAREPVAANTTTRRAAIKSPMPKTASRSGANGRIKTLSKAPSAWKRPDARRLAAIRPCIDPAAAVNHRNFPNLTNRIRS